MNGHTEDKPRDCRYCYFWKQAEGCTYRGKTGCYYISAQKPPAAVSELICTQFSGHGYLN